MIERGEVEKGREGIGQGTPAVDFHTIMEKDGETIGRAMVEANTLAGVAGTTPLVSIEEVPRGGKNGKVTVVGIMNHRVN